MDETFARCTEQALRYLSLREHNCCEMALKLKNKSYSNEVIARTLDFLTEDGSLSEERYVRAYIRSSNRRHPEGRSVMFARLLSKGADRQVCQSVLEDVYTEEYIFQLLDAVYPKKDKAGMLKAGFTNSDISKYMLSKTDNMD